MWVINESPFMAKFWMTFGKSTMVGRFT